MQGKWMRMMIALIAFFVVSTAAYAEIPPASEFLPSGFKVLDEMRMGAAISIRATKPNENNPKGRPDQGIAIALSWQQNPMADRIVEMTANAPEAKAENIPMSGREEPCGKQRHLGGVLTCRRFTPFEAGGDGAPPVTLKMNWQGNGSGGLINISISNFTGSKETAMGWMDSMILKVTKAKQ